MSHKCHECGLDFVFKNILKQHQNRSYCRKKTQDDYCLKKRHANVKKQKYYYRYCNSCNVLICNDDYEEHLISDNHKINLF